MDNIPEFIDKEITCKRCSQTFVWSAGEQIFYHGRHLLPPLKCPRCRAYLKSLIDKREEVENGR